MASSTQISIDDGRLVTPLDADVKLTLSIDAHDIGGFIANLSSPEQAQVILGFYEEIRDAQLAFIGAEPVFDDPKLSTDVARALRDLAAHIEQEG